MANASAIRQLLAEASGGLLFNSQVVGVVGEGVARVPPITHIADELAVTSSGDACTFNVSLIVNPLADASATSAPAQAGASRKTAAPRIRLPLIDSSIYQLN